MLFDHLGVKAADMHYWKGQKITAKTITTPRDKINISLRCISLEQEFLLTMMRLRLGLLVDDLAFLFEISEGLTSSIFTTWLRLLSKYLQWMIVWLERNIIKRNLPTIFRKYYPNCCLIIDCSEIYIETPSSLEVSAMCWSNYKHNSTVKYLVGIRVRG